MASSMFEPRVHRRELQQKKQHCAVPLAVQSYEHHNNPPLGLASIYPSGFLIHQQSPHRIRTRKNHIGVRNGTVRLLGDIMQPIYFEHRRRSQ